MPRSLLLIIISCLASASPAWAQNAREIDRVRSGHSCMKCNLFQADLSYKNLPKLNLSKSRLRQADLSLSTMDRSNFSGANLSVANLYGGRFTHASFRNANLQKAVMVGAYFGYADFTGADFSGAIISGANFIGAKLSQKQLNQACGDSSTVLPKNLHVPSCKQ